MISSKREDQFCQIIQPDFIKRIRRLLDLEPKRLSMLYLLRGFLLRFVPKRNLLLSVLRQAHFGSSRTYIFDTFSLLFRATLSFSFFEVAFVISNFPYHSCCYPSRIFFSHYQSFRAEEIKCIISFERLFTRVRSKNKFFFFRLKVSKKKKKKEANLPT